jgi:hypothetical protein
MRVIITDPRATSDHVGSKIMKGKRNKEVTEILADII